VIRYDLSAASARKSTSYDGSLAKTLPSRKRATRLRLFGRKRRRQSGHTLKTLAMPALEKVRREKSSQHLAIAAPRGGGERVKAPSDLFPPRQRTAKIDTLKAAFRFSFPPLLPGGDGGGFHVARAARAQAGSQ